MTRDIAVQIMASLRSGKKQLAVADEFGVSPQIVSAVAAGTHCCWRADYKPPTSNVAAPVIKPPAPPRVKLKPIDQTKPKRGQADSGCKYLPSQEQIAMECAAIQKMWDDWERESREVYDHPERYEFPTVSSRLFGAA